MIKKAISCSLPFLLLFILSGCRPDKEEKGTSKPKVESSGVRVGISIARLDTIENIIECSAKLSATRKGEIKSLVSSTVQKIFVEDGSRVHAGDTLVILDERHIRNQLEKYKSDFMKAVSNLVIELKSSGNGETFEKWRQYQVLAAESRNIPIYPKPESPQMTVVLSRLQVQSSYNMVKEYELQLENCTITAPFNGIISELEIYPSAYISPATVICKLTDLSLMKMKIDILEEDIGSIKTGNKVKIRGNESGPIQIQSVLPSIDEIKHTGIALAVVENPGLKYKDGQHVQVLLTKTVYANRLVIPRKALLIRNERDLVFVVKNDIAKWQYVDIGVGNADYLEVTGGIEVGDSVIVEGHYSLGHNVGVIVEKLVE